MDGASPQANWSNVQSGRRMQKLGDVVQLLSGGTPSKANSAFWNGDVPWLTPKDMSQWEGVTEAHVTKAAIGKGTKLAPENASYVAVRGMSLHNEIRVVRSARPISFNQDIKAVVAGPSIDPTFLYYALSAAKPVLLGLVSAAGHGTGVLDTDRLRSLEIPTLALDEQRIIAEAMEAFDDKIELNRRMNKTLEGMAQAVFRDWFVDFGPVRRRAAGEADPVAIMGGLTPDPARAAELAAHFPDALGADGLPVGWSRRTVESIMELAYGKSLPKTVRKDGPYPVYGSGGISGTHSTPLANGPGIIVGRKGTVGSLYWEAGDFFAIDTVFYVIPRDGVPLNFAWHLLQTLGLEGMNTDAAVPGLNRGNAYRLEFAFGGSPLLDAFEAIANPLRARQDASNSETKTLAETRDYLLPRLMSGAVRVVPNAEAT
ncbi:type I restriction enzyme S subunit [Erythrobacter lutimaris]|nr:type I restriction enzyme S subunit [Alteriqipengyuania lutimaris]